MPDQYPETLWAKSSSIITLHGLSTVEMEDGTIHSQAFFPPKRFRFRVVHENLDRTELGAILTFIEGHLLVDFLLKEPISEGLYLGKIIGDISHSYQSDALYKASWDFSGIFQP